MNNSVDLASLLPSQEDFDAIMQTILDYVDGWYNADALIVFESLPIIDYNVFAWVALFASQSNHDLLS